MERRKYHRSPIKVMIDYMNGSDIEVVYTRDISLGGMFIETNNLHKKGTLVFLDFNLPGIRKMFKLKGKIAWISDGGKTGQDKEPGMGIEFIELDETNKASLRTGIKNIQGEL